VPFDFLRRKKQAAPEAGRATASRGAGGVAFDGLTEEWRIRGRMQIEGRLSDALNKREAIDIGDVQWAPLDGSAGFSEAPGLKRVDPYDLIVVLAGEDSQAPVTATERTAHKVHKIPYDVALEVPPFRIIGTVFLYPGAEPQSLLARASEMFVPVVEATAYHGELVLSDPEVEAILVNRFYLRGIEQVDKRTGERPATLPGAPLGGVSWQDRSR
jgi:hypothetical protein